MNGTDDIGGPNMIFRRDFLKAASIALLMKDLGTAGFASDEDRLHALCLEGLKQRKVNPADPPEEEIRLRLDKELAVIHQLELDEGFLILAALKRYCRERNILLNLASSANGSLVAYALGLCRLHPQRHSLLFERFIDPGRHRFWYVGFSIDAAHLSEIAQVVQGLPGVKTEAEDWALWVNWGRGESDGDYRLDIGFWKSFDLKTLEKAVEIINQSGQATLALDEIPEDDPKTFELFCQGATEGVYRYGEEGVADFLRMLKPQNLEDLMAVDALYQPESLERGLTKAYLERVWHPDLSTPIIRSRGAFICYQEHIMRIFHQFADMKFSDGLRYARAASRREEAVAHRLLEEFKARTRERGIKQAGERMAEIMSRYAGQTYSKADAAGTAFLGYQMAFVKAHYPSEFEQAWKTTTEKPFEE
jgi:DNA polymerase III alpha subunit